MAKEKEIYEDKFNDALEAFKKEVEKATDPDLKRALYFAFKDYKDKLLEEYSNTIRNKKIDGKEPDSDSVVTEVLMFDNLIFNEFDNFRKLIEKQIEVKSSNYNGEYNRFKKCPHCGIIWFKVKGCDSVVCGKRTKAEDKIIGKYKKYIVTYIDNKVVITFQDLGEEVKTKKFERYRNVNFNMNSNVNYSMNNNMNNNVNFNMNNNMNFNMNNNVNFNMNNNVNFNMNNNMNYNMNNNMNYNMNNNMNYNMNNNMNNNMNYNMNNNIYYINNNMMNIENDDEFIGLTKKENLENLKREKDGKIKIKPYGCGRNLDWKEMEDCSEEVISKLKEIAIDDYHSGLLNISEKFEKGANLSAQSTSQ